MLLVCVFVIGNVGTRRARLSVAPIAAQALGIRAGIAASRVEWRDRSRLRWATPTCGLRSRFGPG